MVSFADRDKVLRHLCDQTSTGAHTTSPVFCSTDSLSGDKVNVA